MRDETVMMRAFLVCFHSFFLGFTAGFLQSWRSSFGWLQMSAEFMAGMIRRSAVVHRAVDVPSLWMSRNVEGMKGFMLCVIIVCYWFVLLKFLIMVPQENKALCALLDSKIGCLQGKHRIQIQNEVQLRCVECLYHPVMSIGSLQLCRLLWVLVLMLFELKAIMKLSSSSDNPPFLSSLWGYVGCDWE